MNKEIVKMHCPYHSWSSCSDIRKKHYEFCRVIYGYTDDGDQELNNRHDKDLWLAGCVPDSYGVFVEEKWYYPTKRCNLCHHFFDYKTEENGAFLESP